MLPFGDADKDDFVESPAVKLTVPDVLPLVRALYARDGGTCGCCLHILLDDGNVEDRDADFCVRHARDAGHADCLDLATKLRAMSRTQRAKLSKLAYT